MTTMTTMTLQAVQASSTKTLPEADIETRLALASVAMDVLLGLAAGPALGEASQAVEEAVTEADLYASSPVPTSGNRILRAAGAVIRARGWHQGGRQGPSGAVCALEAIRLVCGPDTDAEDRAVAELTRRVRRETGRDRLTVDSWNDSQASSRASVLRLLH